MKTKKKEIKEGTGIRKQRREKLKKVKEYENKEERNLRG